MNQSKSLSEERFRGTNYTSKRNNHSMSKNSILVQTPERNNKIMTMSMQEFNVPQINLETRRKTVQELDSQVSDILARTKSKALYKYNNVSATLPDS